MMKTLRFTIVTGLFFIIFVIIFARLFYWQVVSNDKLSALAENQHFVSLEIPSIRGQILDNNKNILVGNEAAYLLYIDLRNLKEDPQKIAAKLAPILSLNKDEKTVEQTKKNLSVSLNNKNSVWVPLAHKISQSMKLQIANLNILGIGFEDEEKRFYPEGSMSAHLLGFVGKDVLGFDKGYFGLEGNYDLELKGKSGKMKLEKDALGRPILLGEQEIASSHDGRSLVTTIDKYVEMQAEKYLQEGIDQFGAKGGDVLIGDPQTGAILAMVSIPKYDPASYEKFSDHLYKNPGISDIFEPGSIMKPVIMSAALDENKVKPATRCPRCNGPRQIGEYTIRTFNDQYHPNLTMTEVLVNSDNTGMVYVGELLGKKNVYDNFYKFGFGSKTGIDLQEEEDGTIKPYTHWYPIDTATVTFGQGIAVTPIQMLRAYFAIANGGKLVKPFVVQKIIKDGSEIDVTPHEDKRILKEETAKVLTQMLISVNNESPLHFPKDRIPELANFKIAAKSGTAQIPLSGHYDPSKTIGSVIGFAPADNPKFVIYVRLLEPSARPWGSDTAGPIFYNIVRDLLFYYNISPQP